MGKATPMPVATPREFFTELVHDPNMAPTITKVSQADTPLEESHLDLTGLSSDEVQILGEMFDLPSAVPTAPSSRDHQPLHLLQSLSNSQHQATKPLDTTHHQRIVVANPSDPLGLSNIPNKRPRIEKENRESMTKEEMMDECDKIDREMEKLKARRDELKRKIRKAENEETSDLRKENEELRKKNALLEERLIAARDVRREEDRRMRQLPHTAVGTQLLRY